MESNIHVWADEPRTCTPPSSSNTYEWEDQNFYEILNLPSPPSTASRTKRRNRRASISSTDVKRAYRKAAQKYHPDKVAKNQTMTIEERNARFARIAEAYEVLNNEEKRVEYDSFLLDCEDHLSGQQEDNSSSSSWSSVFGDLSTDPRRVFEEFFFGSPSSESATWEDVGYNDNRRRARNRSTTPVRVYETQEFHRDPQTGFEILRMLQTEEFETETDGQLYYRVSGQDFVEHYDRFNRRSYVPVTQPFVVEEGYKQEDSHHAGTEESISNTLSPGEYLMPESGVLKSSNDRFYAGLSPECDLLIMTENIWYEDEEVTVWSSGTYVPPSHLYSRGGCFLGPRGPHLVLALGSPDRPGSILWYSDVPDDVIEEEERILAMGGQPSLYIARLDDDGSLAVYRHETSPPPNADEDMESTWWYKVFDRPRRTPRTRAARALVRLQDWCRERLLHQHRSRQFPREICIYATGPVGCHARGRQMFHFAQDVNHSMKHAVDKMESALDSFLNDEDKVDVIIRVVNNAVNRLLLTTRKMIRTQTRYLHTLYQSFMKRLYSSRRSRS